jgi:hypothetical protein
MNMMKQVTVGTFSPVSVASTSHSSDLPSPPSPRPPTIVPEKSLVRSIETPLELGCASLICLKFSHSN